MALLIPVLLLSTVVAVAADNSIPPIISITTDDLHDRLYGGWVGMLVGGLEGLAHEFKYDKEPRDTLPDFPWLPQGACSDDDNDFEWTHLWFMDQEHCLKLPYPRLMAIWQTNMRTGIWCANEQAVKLMDQGVVPPATSDPRRNRWAWFNLAGQFCTESYGLIAPGMPRTAADIGLHYASISVSGEPLQATQYWTSLISLAMVDRRSLPELMTAALPAMDPRCAMSAAVRDALAAWKDCGDDWKKARQRIRQTWMVEQRWNKNAVTTNGALVVLALLYGGDDLYRTMQYAMAMGWDADCNAATAGAVVGCRWGFKRIAALPGFAMPDRYVNKTRPELPKECRVSDQVEVMLRVATRVIMTNGGQTEMVAGKPGFRLALQAPGCVQALPVDALNPSNAPPAPKP